jgi:hypothetical protein
MWQSSVLVQVTVTKADVTEVNMTEAQGFRDALDKDAMKQTAN